MNDRLRHILPLACLLAMLLATGCKVGPNYAKPQEKMPDGFSAAAETQPTATQPTVKDIEQWWTSLDDDALDSLVERAVKGNLDVALAASRVSEARASESVAISRLTPTVNANVGSPPGSGLPPLYNRASQTIESIGVVNQRSVQPGFQFGPGGLGPATLNSSFPGHRGAGIGLNSGAFGSAITAAPGASNNIIVAPDARLSPGGVNLTGPALGGGTRVVNRDEFTFSAGFAAAWEIDVFGGLRRAIEAADASAQAVDETRNDVLLVVVSDVARTYAQLRGFQWRSDIATSNIAEQQQSLDLVTTRFKTGIGNELDVAQATRQLAMTEAVKGPLDAGAAEARHRLGVLLGGFPAALDDELNQQKALPSVPGHAPTDLPSELLRRRPDIRRAERELAAQTARVGVAVAMFFPKFYLTGSFGPQTSDIREMLNADSLTWSAGPGMRWPLIDFALIGELRIQELRAQQALINYRQTLLIALREVEDAIAAYNGQSDKSVQLERAAEAARSATRLSMIRYETGLVDYLNVIDALRSQYEIEDSAALAKQQLVENFVQLYRALGGGWEHFAKPLPDARLIPPAVTQLP